MSMNFPKKKTLILIRGIPGSGKSTLAAYLTSLFEAAHFETDMFFEGYKGYVFDASFLSLAHEWCQGQTRLAMKLDLPVIIVSNTFSKAWEWQFYEGFAEIHGYRLIIIETTYPGTSIHNVPEHIVANMLSRWEKVDETAYVYIPWDYKKPFESEKILCQLLLK